MFTIDSELGFASRLWLTSGVCLKPLWSSDILYFLYPAINLLSKILKTETTKVTTVILQKLFLWCVSVVVRRTIAGHLSSLTLQVLRAVCPECCESAMLLEAIQKGLLLLLRMGCQNLLGQAQPLVGLPLLTGRGNSRKRRSPDVVDGLYRLSCPRDILYDLYTNDTWRTFNIMQSDERVEFFLAWTVLFDISSDDNKSNEGEWKKLSHGGLW